MEPQLDIWLTPVTLLPGVALLLISTVARSGQIEMEIHRMLDNKDDASLVDHVSQRSTLVRNAIVGMYVSIAIFALASMLGGLAAVVASWTELALWIVVLLTGLGILALFAGTYFLIRESTIRHEMAQQRCRRVAAQEK